jgi:hypothetical protein
VIENKAGIPISNYATGSTIPNFAGASPYLYQNASIFLPTTYAYNYPNPSGGSVKCDNSSILFTQKMADDGVTLTISGFLYFGDYTFTGSGRDTWLRIYIGKLGPGPITLPNSNLTTLTQLNLGTSGYANQTLTFTHTFTPQDIRNNVGNTFYLYSSADSALAGGNYYPNYFCIGYDINITQTPNAGTNPIVTISSDIWEPTIFPLGNGIKLSPNGTQLYPIFTQNPTNPTWYFQGIPNSGYGDILTPIGIRRGDEFRFNNDDSKVYLVDYVVDTGSNIEIYFDRNVSTNSPLDINKYSITRYVDDASRIVIKGFRPNNTDGPYILRPEFVVPELDKGIDEFIVDLTQKGLL